MATPVYYKNIQRQLFMYADLVEQSNSVGLSDESIHAEDFICYLLNTIFGWKLKNANTEKKNQDSFDLVDKSRRLFVQVTSNKSHATKYKKTVESFRKNTTRKGFSKLIVLFISKNCSLALLTKQQHTKFTSEAYSISKLLTALHRQALPATALQSLSLAIQEYLRPVDLTGSGENAIAEIIKQQTGMPKRKGIAIKRDELISDLADYAQAGNGLIIGGPGGGKTHSIEELQKFCLKNKVPCFVIRINELLSGSDDEINKFLGVRKNWLTALKTVIFSGHSKKGILIFDAFDTAKEENLRSAILVAIRRAITELKTNWNIIVSSRSFEATKSTRLMEIFPPANITNPVYCRYFEIPLLSSNEVESSIRRHAKLYSLYLRSSPDLREILRTPYFLKLFERIVMQNDALKVSEVSHIETAEQLLSKFWDIHVISDSQKDLLLRNLTRLLVTKENLSIRKEEIVTPLNVTVLDSLLSDGILVEAAPSKQKLAFAHNILLEYAVSIYLLPEEASEIIHFIEENKKLPFHFRQSFIYFYNQLWRSSTTQFWKHYEVTRAANTALFRLYHQTILNFVVVTSFNKAIDLQVIWSIADKQERANVIRKILEGVRFLKKETLSVKDVIFLEEVSKEMHEFFLWELGFLLNKVFEDQKNNPTRKVVPHLTKAVFNYLTFILSARLNSPNKFLIETNGFNWGMRILCDVFEYDKKTAAKYVSQVLDILKEPEFPIRIFWLLTDGITKIFTYDKPTAISIYRAAYFHTETSKKETTLGNSVVMNLRSNRKQDFESIHHHLETETIKLLAISPSHIIPLTIEIANKFGASSWSSSWRGNPHIVKVAGIRSKLIQDFTIEPLAEDDEKYGPSAPIARVFDKLTEDIKAGNSRKEIIGNLHVVLKHAELSSVWKRVMDHFTEFPKFYKEEAFSLLLNVAFLIAEETAYEAGRLITALWPFLSVRQKQELEAKIHSLATSELVKDDPDFTSNRIHRYLSCIPDKEFHDTRSVDIIAEQGTKENKPLLDRPRLMRHNADRNEKMLRAGLDSTVESDNNLYDKVEKLEIYNHRFDQDSKLKPLKTEYLPLLQIAIDLFDHYLTNAFPNDKFKEHCEYHISSFVRNLARLGNILPKKIREQVVRICKSYIIDITHYSFLYEEGDLKNSHSAFSPTPRINSVGALTALISIKEDADLAATIKPLIADNSRIVRWKVMRVFTYFWHHDRAGFWLSLRPRYRKEFDAMCLSELMRNISYNNIIEDNLPEAEFAATEILQHLKTSPGEVGQDIWRFYSALLLKLIYFFNSEKALALFNENLDIKPLTRAMILHLFSIVDPHDPDNSYVTNAGRHDKEFDLMKKILSHQFRNIQEKGLKGDGISDNFEILDQFIQHFNFTILHGKKPNKGKSLSKANESAFFNAIKPVLSFFVDESGKIDSGFMVAHTGYYFMQVLNKMLPFDPVYVLSLSASIVRYSAESGFTYDNSTLAEIVKMTELIMADHKMILDKPDRFNDLLTILDLFANSGWQEAIELTWKLKEVF